MPYYQKKGMRIGSKHYWNYNTDKWNETKIAPRLWKFTYYQTKKRHGRNAPYGTGMPLGSKLHWKIRANQYAIKTSPNTYKLIMRGTKYQAGYTTKKYQKYRR